MKKCIDDRFFWLNQPFFLNYAYLYYKNYAYIKYILNVVKSISMYLFLHFCYFSLQAQDILAETVHNAFKFLVGALTEELEMCMPMVLSEVKNFIFAFFS